MTDTTRTGVGELVRRLREMRDSLTKRAADWRLALEKAADLLDALEAALKWGHEQAHRAQEAEGKCAHFHLALEAENKRLREELSDAIDVVGSTVPDFDIAVARALAAEAENKRLREERDGARQHIAELYIERDTAEAAALAEAVEVMKPFAHTPICSTCGKPAVGTCEGAPPNE